MTLQDWIALVSALTALVAVVVSPFLSLYIARSQLLAPMRQKWIDEFRLLMSEYLAAIHKLLYLKSPPSPTGDSTELELVDRMLVLAKRILLMLNQDDPNHDELLQRLSDMWKLQLGEKAKEEGKEKRQKMLDLERRISTLSYSIVRAEWAKITARTN